MSPTIVYLKWHTENLSGILTTIDRFLYYTSNKKLSTLFFNQNIIFNAIKLFAKYSL